MAGKNAYESNSGCLLGFVVILLFVALFSFSDQHKVIKSRSVLKPTIEITLNNQVIDTLYVYKLK